MQQVFFYLLMISNCFLFGMQNMSLDDNKAEIITAIQDNGCSKQAQIELSQTKSNADVYNYAALSTSY